MNMKGAFLWLAVFFKKRYLPLWDRRKSISYLMVSTIKGVLGNGCAKNQGNP